LFAIAFSFLRVPEKKDVVQMDKAIEEEFGGQKAKTCLISAQWERICYTVCNKMEGRFIAGLGGLFVGLISTGLGELNGYFLLQRCRVPSKVAVATSVFVIAFTALSGAFGHLLHFIQTGRETLNLVSSVVIFTVPGVIIGAQLGASLASRIPQRTLEKSLGILFVLIAMLTLGEVLL